MSFNISIQYNKSPKNKIGKTIDNITTINGNLRDDSSIIDPVFIVDSTITELRKSNYCTIGAWGRSYFITDIKTIRQGLIELHCHVDVLESFKNEIKSNKGIIKRNQHVSNKYLNDGFFKVYQNPNIVMYEFPNGFTDYEWVLAMAGNSGQL